MTRTLLVGISVLALAGCGGDEEPAVAPATTATTASTAQPATAGPKRGRSVPSCAKLWNADALPVANSQVSANDFLAKEAPVRVAVTFKEGNCIVAWPIRGGRVEFSVAFRGRRPYANPERERLGPGRVLRFNARADREGRLALD